MAEDLDDGEFWLPSHFLTDDDILMDFDFPAQKPNPNSASSSDLEMTSASTETESDEEDILLAGLARQLPRSCPVHSSKGYVLSSSPQSTLCGCVCNQGSSRESLSGPVSPPQRPPEDNNATLDLLNKAAGEVARLKMRTEKKSGTGFFDCSQKGGLYPSPIMKPEHFPPVYFQPQFHHFPPMVWAPSNGMSYNPTKQSLQNRATKNNNMKSNKNSSNNINRPLGLPPSAWPPLQPQAQAQAQAHPMPAPPMFAGPKRECTGTGVFLPRVTTPPPETRKKTDGNATTKSSKSGKGSQSNHRRNGRTTKTTVNENEIQLPQEWTY